MLVNRPRLGTPWIGLDNYRRLLDEIADSYGPQTLLSEAGPRVYGAMIDAGVVDDEFVTLIPILVGNRTGEARPGLIEDVAFDPDAPPRSRLLAAYRSGDYLFLHSRYSQD